MDTVTYPDPEVRAELSGWIEQRVDVSASAGVARALGVPAVPAIVALDGDGRVLGRRQGFVAPHELVHWLEVTLLEATRLEATRARTR